jgi:hypothetical protein
LPPFPVKSGPEGLVEDGLFCAGLPPSAVFWVLAEPLNIGTPEQAAKTMSATASHDKRPYLPPNNRFLFNPNSLTLPPPFMASNSEFKKGEKGRKNYPKWEKDRKKRRFKYKMFCLGGGDCPIFALKEYF